MTGQRELFPAGLTQSQFKCLDRCAGESKLLPPGELRQRSEQHLKNAETAAESNRLINIRLAKAILEVIRKILDQWETLPEHYRYWLCGAMLYFSSGNDDEPDFSSPIGFEDDTEVLNACLRFAKLDHLCLKVENFDDV